MTNPTDDQDPRNVVPVLITMPDGTPVTERDIDLAVAAAFAKRADQAPAVPQYAADAAASVLTASLHGGMSMRDVPEVARAMLAAALQGTGLTLMHTSYLAKQAREARAMVEAAETALQQLRQQLDALGGPAASVPRRPPPADPAVWPEPTMVARPGGER